MVKRKARNLTEPPDLVLTPEVETIAAWLKEGPCDGSTVVVPRGTERIYAYDPPPEAALTIEKAVPRIAVYEWDQGMRGGGFLVMHVVRYEPMPS